MNGWLLAIIALWIVCGVVAYGGTLAYWWRAFPGEHNNLKWRTDQGYALFIAGFGPLGLWISGLMSGFFYYGFLYRRPR